MRPPVSTVPTCCCCSYFRYCITQILDKLLKGEFKFGDEKSLGMERKGKSTRRNQRSKTSECKASVDKELQVRKDGVKEYMVANNRNWGKMSAMKLAAQTLDRQIISHDLCWRIICKVWRRGKIRQQVK